MTNYSFWVKGIGGLLIIASMAVCAESYEWVGGENGSWASDESFSPKGTPGADDEVLLPTGTTRLDASDDGEFAAANAIKRIRPNDNCILEIDVGNKDRTLSFAFTYQAQDGRNRGKMIKKGSGSLALGSTRDDYLYKSSTRYDYYSDFDIVEGTLKLPQDGTAGISVKLGNVAISNNATFFTLATPSTSPTHTYVLDLWGEADAVITNTAPVSYAAGQVLSPQGSSLSVFAGKICSPVRWWGSGRCHLTGTANELSPSSMFAQSGNTGRGFDGPYAGVMSFGRKGEPSSIGTYGYIYSRDNGGAFKYLGSGEETDVDFLVASAANTPYPGYLSGGDAGGLIWTGLWYPDSARLMQRLVIAGDGGTNFMRGAIQRRTYDGTNYTFYIRKQGRGTWRIEDGSKGNDVYYQMHGGWAVEEGTLQFTSISETNFISSLGVGLDLFKDVGGAKLEANRVSYGFALGGDETEGTLEYVGTADDICTERPIWLYGDGAFKNDGTAKVRFRGVSSVTPEENPAARAVTFTLKGSGTGENEILDITDSAARPVSVVKEGSGKWVLGGEQSFHGTLDVKGGTLILRRPEKYTWHRWVITSKEGTVGAANNYYQMQEFALFGAESHKRQNYGLAYNANYAALAPGQVAYGTDKVPVLSSSVRQIDCLFDDLKKSAAGDENGWNGTMRAPNSASGYQAPVRGDPFSWIPIVMRLPVDSEAITSYDVVYYQTNSHVRSATSYFVDGSVDGVHWNRLSDVDTVGVVRAGYWQYAATSFGAGGQRNNEHTSGCTIASAPDSLFDVLNNAKSVSVAAGATLAAEGNITLPGLAVDFSEGGGTISNFTFAASGEVCLSNVPDGNEPVLPGWTFVDCTDMNNIASWNVYVDGAPRSRWRAKASADGVVSILRPGMVVSFK